MNIVEFLKVIVFSLVEGFTEWLPISSTGHLILLQNIIPLAGTKEFFSTFEVLIQLGAVMAVVQEIFFPPFSLWKRKRGGGRSFFPRARPQGVGEGRLPSGLWPALPPRRPGVLGARRGGRGGGGGGGGERGGGGGGGGRGGGGGEGE